MNFGETTSIGLVWSNNPLSCQTGILKGKDARYRNRINQTFSMSTDVKKEKKAAPKPVDDDSDNQTTSAEHDDEFVSDLHQASSKDLAEADEAMKKLGLSKV